VEVTIDALGRLAVPEPLRSALGLTPGTIVDLSRYGAGLLLVPAEQAARIVEDHGGLIAESSTAVTDEVVADLLDAARR
jgi:AbrB family looped-hinge helix DNA binding protein